MALRIRVTVRADAEIRAGSSAAVGSVEALHAESDSPRHVELAEPVVHPWHLAQRPSGLTAFVGVTPSNARKILRGTLWVRLDGAKRVRRFLQRAARFELLTVEPEAQTETFSAALETLWQQIDRSNPLTTGSSKRARDRALMQHRWLRDAGALPATLLTRVVSVPASRAMSAALLRRFTRLVKVNQALASAPSEATRAALFDAVEHVWQAQFFELTHPTLTPAASEVVTLESLAPDPSLTTHECGLSVDVLRVLFGGLLFEHLIQSGRALDLDDALDLMACEPSVLYDALDALCARHHVILVQRRPFSTQQVVTLRPVIREGFALRLHPARMWHFVDGLLGVQPVRVMLPTTARAQRELARLGAVDFAQPPSGAARLGLHSVDGGVRSLPRALQRSLSPEAVHSLMEELWRRGADAVAPKGWSLAIDDFAPHPAREALVAQARKRADDVLEQYLEGVITDSERRNKVIDVWSGCAYELSRDAFRRRPEGLLSALHESTPGFEWGYVQRCSDLVGLVFSPNREALERPVLRSFRDGLSAHEYALVCLTGRHPRIADHFEDEAAGLMIEQLIAVVGSVQVIEDDCASTEGVWVSGRLSSWPEAGPLEHQGWGRAVLCDVVHPITGALVASAGSFLDEAVLKSLEDAGVGEVMVRSPLGCLARGGVCRKCYGLDDTREADAGASTALSIGGQSRVIARTRVPYVGC